MLRVVKDLNLLLIDSTKSKVIYRMDKEKEIAAEKYIDGDVSLLVYWKSPVPCLNEYGYIFHRSAHHVLGEISSEAVHAWLEREELNIFNRVQNEECYIDFNMYRDREDSFSTFILEEKVTEFGENSRNIALRNQGLLIYLRPILLREEFLPLLENIEAKCSYWYAYARYIYGLFHDIKESGSFRHGEHQFMECLMKTCMDNAKVTENLIWTYKTCADTLSPFLAKLMTESIVISEKEILTYTEEYFLPDGVIEFGGKVTSGKDGFLDAGKLSHFEAKCIYTNWRASSLVIALECVLEYEPDTKEEEDTKDIVIRVLIVELSYGKVSYTDNTVQKIVRLLKESKRYTKSELRVLIRNVLPNGKVITETKLDQYVEG